MAKQPRQQPIGFYGKFQPTGVDNSAAQRMQALAGLGETVAGIAEQFGAKKASEKKAEDAKTARMNAPEEAALLVQEARTENPDGTVTYSAIPTPTGAESELRLRTLVAAQLSSTKVDAQIKFAEIAEKNQGDPEAFYNDAETYRKSVVGASPIESRDTLNLEMIPKIQATFKALNTAFEKATDQASLVSLKDNKDFMFAELGNSIQNGTFDREQTASLYSTIDAIGNADPSFNVVGARREIDNYIYEQTASKVIGDIAKKDGITAARGVLEELENSPLPAGYSQEALRSFIESETGNLTRKASALKAINTQESTESKAAVSSFVEALGLGFEVSQAEQTRAQGLVQTPDQQDKIDRARRVSAFSVMSEQDRDAVIKNRESGQLDDLEDWKQMIARDIEIQDMAKKDGYSLYVKQGFIKAIPFDATNAESFALKEEQAGLASIHYGVPVSPFSDEEATALSASINGMTSEEKVILANTIGPDSDAWGQIAGKNQGLFAMVASIGDQDLMQAIFLGQDLITNKLQVRLPNDPIVGGYLSDFNDAVGDVYLAEDKRYVLDATLALYAQRGEDYSSGSFEDAIQEVTGGIKEINDYKVQLPRGISKRHFQDYVERFSAEDVIAFGGVSGYTPEQAAVAIQDGRIVSDGDNRYRVLVNGSVPLTSPNGQKFIFSYTESVVSEQAGMAAEQMQKNAELFRKEYGISAPKDTTYDLEAESKKFSESRNRALNKAGFIDLSKRGN
jgi:hypothetical protein